MRVNAYAAPAAGQPLAPTTIERRDVGPNDVLIEIEYAGICHSDIHTVNGDWGPQPFPVVPGHEIVGIVTEVGAEVTTPPGRRPRRRRLHGQLLRRVRQLPQRRRAVLPQRHGRHLRRHRPRRHHHPGRLLHPRRRRRRLRPVASPTASTRPPPRRCCAPASPPTRRCAAGAPDPGKKVAVVGLGGLGPHGRQDRPRPRRRGHRALAVAEEAGGRPAPRRRPLLRHLATPTPSSSSPAGSTSSSTPSAPASTSTPTSACSPSTAPWSTSAPRPSR